MENGQNNGGHEEQLGSPEGVEFSNAPERETQQEETPLTPRQIATEKYRQAHRNLDSAARLNLASPGYKSNRILQESIGALKESGQELQRIVDAENRAKREAARREKQEQGKGLLGRIFGLIQGKPEGEK